MNNKDIEFINQKLELIILPTEQCDCRCIYCNQEFKEKKMDPNTVVGIKKLIEKRIFGLKKLIIQWFGGEPLLGSDIIQDIMEYVQKLKNVTNPDLDLTGMMTTNATHLNTALLNNLVKLGVKDYQITLDGDKEEHNKLRIKAGGSGTFDIIWKNLVDAHKIEADFNILIRMHVNMNNEESMRQLILKISKEIENDKRFTLYIRLLSRYGGKNDDVLPICKDTESMKRLREFAELLGVKYTNFNPHKNEIEYICYAAKPYAYIIRSDAKISKCTVALYDDDNIIGQINPDGTLHIDNEKAFRFSRGLFNGNKEEMACPMKFIKEERNLLRYKNEEKIRVPLKIIG